MIYFFLCATFHSLPDDDRDVRFMDYYVDESGEWDPWVSRVPESVYSDHHDLLGEVFIDTIDTVSILLMCVLNSCMKWPTVIPLSN